MSKGSRPRPYSVSQQEFANNFDAIFRKPEPKVVEDQKNEDDEFYGSKGHGNRYKKDTKRNRYLREYKA